LKIYEGGSHGICTTEKSRINEDLLAFAQAAASAGMQRSPGFSRRVGAWPPNRKSRVPASPQLPVAEMTADSPGAHDENSHFPGAFSFQAHPSACVVVGVNGRRRRPPSDSIFL
jgi:hypothetical protein